MYMSYKMPKGLNDLECKAASTNCLQRAECPQAFQFQVANSTFFSCFWALSPRAWCAQTGDHGAEGGGGGGGYR